MNNWNIRVPKDMQAHACARELHILSIGYWGGGRGEATLYATEEQATILWCMAHNMIGSGMTPEAALAKVQDAIARQKASRDAEEATPCPSD